MVLATRLIAAKYLYLVLFSSGCQAEGINITDQTRISGHELQLTTDEHLCKLVAAKDGDLKTFKLAIKPPCHFMRRDSEEVQQYAYPDKKIEAISLIVGTPASEEKRQKWNLEKDLICGEQRQAIIITANRINVSESILEGGIACKDKGADEKDFAFFAQQLQ